MSEELKITKERVLRAAESCEIAKEVLEELFPEAFTGKRCTAEMAKWQARGKEFGDELSHSLNDDARIVGVLSVLGRLSAPKFSPLNGMWEKLVDYFVENGYSKDNFVGGGDNCL